MPTMRDALHAGTCPSSAADSVACFLARLHTTAPSQAAAEQEVTDSSNRVTDSNRARAEAALFSWPFEGARELLDVEKETSLVAAAGELHAVFDTHRQHHVHGDLHTGAVSDAAGEPAPLPLSTSQTSLHPQHHQLQASGRSWIRAVRSSAMTSAAPLWT